MSVVGTQDNFKTEVLDYKDGPVMVDFWAEWCVPCKMVAPILDEIAESHKNIKYVKVETDNSPEVTDSFGIMSIPTVIFFKDGKELTRIVGAQPKENFELAVNDTLK